MYFHFRRRGRFLGLSVALLLLNLPGVASGQSNFWEAVGGPSGGAILSLVIGDSGHIFAGTFNGGVFRSTDSGASWHPSDAALTHSPIYTLFRLPNGDLLAGSVGYWRSTDNGYSWSHPVNPMSHDFVYSFAVTSLGHIFAASNTGGVFRSTDDGGSWTQAVVGIVPCNAGGFCGRSVLVDDGDYVYAGTGGGIYRSTNDGDTWAVKSDCAAGPMVVNDSGHIFSVGCGVVRSTDHGNTWRIVLSDIGSASSILITPAGQLFAGACGTGNSGEGGVYRSMDNGFSWTQVNSGLTDTCIRSLTIGPSGKVFAGGQSAGVFRSIQTTTGVEEAGEWLPRAVQLGQNYPNPFNPRTVIGYSLVVNSHVVLKIYDILGQEVRTLVDGIQEPGYRSVEFDAGELPSGVYIYKLTAGSFTDVKKMLVIK